MKRFRTPKAKPDQLLVKYGQKCGDRDLFYCWPENDCQMKASSHCVMSALEKVEIHDGKTLRKILEERGFDITTLKFSVMKKVEITELSEKKGKVGL